MFVVCLEEVVYYNIKNRNILLVSPYRRRGNGKRYRLVCLQRRREARNDNGEAKASSFILEELLC